MTKRFLLSSLSIPVLLMAAVSSCTSQAANQEQSATKKNEVSGTTSAGCDQSLWNHVYDPSRLKILNQCMTVTGTVAESNVDEDGDQHFLVKLDRGQDQLLTKKNVKKKDGDLVAEIVCANKVK